MGRVREGMSSQALLLHTVLQFSSLFQAFQFEEFEETSDLTSQQMFQSAFPHERRRNLTWLNSANWVGADVAMVNMTYGNQAEMAWHYSHAVILIDIPKRGERHNF